MPKKTKNRNGIRYGRLVVVEFAGYNWNGYNFQSSWLCKCDCGREIIIKSNYLQNGTQSCGCLQREIVSEKMSKQIGKDGPNYVNGKSCGKHTKAIHKLKEECRKKANYKCQNCDKTQEQNKKETGEILSVHHIDGDDTNNNPENLKVLCKSCHRKTIKCS